jgi:hypothetical protein
MELKLSGRFSYINKYNKLVFVYIEDDTQSKLNRIDYGKKPYDCDGFTVSLPKNTKDIPDDIRSKLGIDCVVNVSVNKYKFTSKLQKNKGELVEGFNLVLLDIKPTERYQF